MKKIVFILFLIACYASDAQNADSTWIRDNYIKKEVYISMRDGIKLFTSIYMPRDTTAPTHPILFKRTPYSCAPYGEDKWFAYWDSFLNQYFKEGYIIVTQDVRGRWMSEG